MRFDELKSRVRKLPIVASWPQMLEIVERVVHKESISVWEHPVSACRAVGGGEEAALPAAAAVLCSVISIHLVDDMLDDDPRGDYRLLGAGPAANLGLAFQAAGPPAARAGRGCRRGAGGAAGELRGDVARHLLRPEPRRPGARRASRNTGGWWRARRRRSSARRCAWARCSAAPPPATADQLARLGRVLGRFIQVSDDLTDALETPARADWQRRSNSLPLLYAMTAAHAEREEFLRLSARVRAMPEALAAAQKILFRSGAVSYCTLKMIEFSRRAAGSVRARSAARPRTDRAAPRGPHPAALPVAGEGRRRGSRGAGDPLRDRARRFEVSL